MKADNDLRYATFRGRLFRQLRKLWLKNSYTVNELAESMEISYDKAESLVSGDYDISISDLIAWANLMDYRVQFQIYDMQEKEYIE
tara:strand:- start:662 stop:919 length:258 start_codon:yes stop_codon:yes gene_type:complete